MPKNTTRPLTYMQIADELRRKIAAGEIPTEPSKVFSLSDSPWSATRLITARVLRDRTVRLVEGHELTGNTIGTVRRELIGHHSSVVIRLGAETLYRRTAAEAASVLEDRGFELDSVSLSDLFGAVSR